MTTYYTKITFITLLFLNGYSSCRTQIGESIQRRLWRLPRSASVRKSTHTSAKQASKMYQHRVLRWDERGVSYECIKIVLVMPSQSMTCCFTRAHWHCTRATLAKLNAVYHRSTQTYQSIYVHLLAKNNFDNTDNTHNTRRSCPTQGSNEGVLHNMLAQEMCALFLSQTILAWLYTLVPRISVLIAYFLLHFSIG